MMYEEDAEDNGIVWDRKAHDENTQRLEYPDYNPVENLLGKLDHWLMQQPEWAIILASPRTVRRQAITLLAKRLVTIPNRYGK